LSEGQPTKLVRDGGAQSYDPPPPGPPKSELVEVPNTEPSDCSAEDGFGHLEQDHPGHVLGGGEVQACAISDRLQDLHVEAEDLRGVFEQDAPQVRLRDGRLAR